MKKILVRAPNWIGDQIMAYPFFSALRRNEPDAWIAVVCISWVEAIQFRGFVDEVFVIPRSKGDSWFTLYRKLRSLSSDLEKQGPWDLGITLPNSFGSALLLSWSKVLDRRGYNTDGRGFWLNQKLDWDSSPDIHRSEAYAKLAGGGAELSYANRNYWKLSGETQFDPKIHWPQVVPIPAPNEDYCVVGPGAVADSRRWSAEQFGELIHEIHQRKKMRTVVIGGAAEKSIAERFLTWGLPIIDLTGQGGVPALSEVLKNSKMTIVNESGLAHVSALCGSPTLIVCGAANPKRTKPIGPGVVHLRFNSVECWPCERNSCQWTDSRRNQCLKGISPQSVMEEFS